MLAKMTIFYERGSPEEVITPRDVKEALDVVFEKLGKRCAFSETAAEASLIAVNCEENPRVASFSPARIT